MSVRTRLTVWYSSALVLVLVAYALAVTILLQHRLYAALDGKLAEDREVSEQLLQALPDGSIALKAEDHGSESLLGFVLVVQAGDGRVLLTFPKAAPPNWSRGALPSWHGVRSLADGDATVRVLSDDEIVGGQSVILHVARSEAALHDQIREITLVLALLLPLSLLVAAVGGWFLARRALLPIAQMAEQARRISADRLGERMPIANQRDEIGRLGHAFNDTLARLERAFAQLRQFTADASHELRTPLTAMRSVGEVGLRSERDVAGHREVIGSMLEEVDRLTRLVDTLLLIARSDGGALVLARTDIDLGELAGEAITALAVLAEEKNLRTTIVSPTPVVVSGDRTMLRQVLVNLLHNAIRHSPMGASITIECGIAGEHAQCSVLDHGPGIPAEHRGRVFERFYRVDDARTQASGGTGLGLALALSIVEMHGGTIELVDRSGPGTLFRFGLPRLAP